MKYFNQGLSFVLASLLASLATGRDIVPIFKPVFENPLANNCLTDCAAGVIDHKSIDSDALMAIAKCFSSCLERNGLAEGNILTLDKSAPLVNVIDVDKMLPCDVANAAAMVKYEICMAFAWTGPAKVQCTAAYYADLMICLPNYDYSLSTDSSTEPKAVDPLLASRSTGDIVLSSSLNKEEKATFLKAARAYLPEDWPHVSDEELLATLDEVQTHKGKVVGYSSQSVSIMAAPCEVEVTIDVIALVLGTAGVPGRASKSIATKMWRSLKPQDQKRLIRLVRSIGYKPSDAPEVIAEIFLLLVETLSWNTVKDALSELSWWDYALVLANITAIMASGGAALAIKIALLANDVAGLVISIDKCFF